MKIWQVTADKKAQVSARQLEIHRKFRSETGLLIDVVKQGHGKRWKRGPEIFRRSGKTASISGLKKDLIERCATILRALSSGYEIDVEAFRNFTVETARYYVAEYAFYYMQASVHEVIFKNEVHLIACCKPNCYLEKCICADSYSWSGGDKS